MRYEDVSQLSLMNLTYEEQRLENIRKNEDLLRSLGLGAPSEATTLATPSNLKTAGNQRRYNDTLVGKSNTGRNRSDSPRKRPTKDREDLNLVPQSAIKRRQSVRLGGKEKPNYTREQVTFNSDRDTPNTPSRQIKSTHSHPGSEEEDIRQVKTRTLGVRVHNPKTFGHIPGIGVGKWWATRMEASADAVHAPTVAGISGNAHEGAWSVALSGGYPDEYVSEMTFHSNVDTESSDDQYRLGLRFHLHRMRRPRFKRNQTKSKKSSYCSSDFSSEFR